MKKILVIDDEEHLCTLLIAELSDSSFEVISHYGLGSKEDVLSFILSEKPNIIILDIKFPKFNGLDLLQDIRNAIYDMPVIIWTASDLYKTDMRTMAADFYVVKSFNLSELKNKVNLLIDVNDEDVDQDKLETIIKEKLIEFINFHFFGSVTLSDLPLYSALINSLKERRTLDLITDDRIKNIGDDLAKHFFIELKTAHENILSIFKEDNAPSDLKKEEFFRKLHIGCGDFSVLSERRLEREIDSIKALIATGYEVRNVSNYNDRTILRSIEFPREYHQAGVSILSFFGAVLRNKYPESNAKVQIVQDGLKVTMIIDPVEGKRETIEKALDDFGLVITGKMSFNEYTNDKILELDLKNQLINANAIIDMQRNLLNYQNDQIEKKDFQIDGLLKHVEKALSNPIHVNIPITSMAESKIEQVLHIAPTVSLLQKGLCELQEDMPENSGEAKTINGILEGLEGLQDRCLPDDVKKSSTMQKLSNFLVDASKAGSKVGKTLRGIKNGVRIAQDLAEYYNSLAQWCGMPQVPKPFLKKR